MARPGPARGQLHVGRYFLALLVLFAALYSAVTIGGLTPKLGLDLKGGAQVILTPKSANGKKVTQAQLTAAEAILRQRVDARGVSEADVVIQGDQIVVSVPGGNRDSVAKVTKATAMEFRRVVEETASIPSTTTTAPATSATPTPIATLGGSAVSPKPSATANKRPVSNALRGTAATPTPTPTPSATPSATPTPSASADASTQLVSGSLYTAASFAALDCSNPTVREGGAPENPTKEIVACSRDGAVKYHLAVAKVYGKDIKGARVGNDQTTGEVQVILSFKGKGQDRWTALTKETFQQTAPTNQVAILLDGLVILSPTTQGVINGDATITGQFSSKEGQDLSNNLKFGALPVSFTAGEAQFISASLGTDQLHSGLLAGGIGLVAVVIYSLIYYRMLGFVTIASLLVSAGLVYGSICVLGDQLGLALSLAGIAGFIVSVGITADSFVVFFERLKDEIKEGRTPRSAVDRAWVRARRTIINADAVSLLAAIVLYKFSVGGVQGFAFTLGLSTVLDLVVVFLFTRPLISWLSRFRWFAKSRLTGFFGPDGGEPSTGNVRAPLAAKPAAAKPAGGLS